MKRPPVQVRRAAILLAFLVAACDRAPPAAVERSDAETAATIAPATAPAATPTPITGAQISTLAGEWRVAAIDGGELNEVYGLALSANADEIWWSPRCAGMIREYRIRGFGFSTQAPSQPERDAPAHGGPPPPPPVVCAIALPPRLSEVMTALSAAVRIERTPANGVLLSGGGHSVLLFSQ